MKKLLNTILFLISVPYLFSFSGGNGTEASPYLISNIQDINTLRDSVLSTSTWQISQPHNWSREKYFKLTQDIIEAVEEPIGDRFLIAVGDRTFGGHFDGQGYKITLAINNSNQAKPVGLFGYVIGATILNLVLDGSIITNGSSGSLVAIGFDYSIATTIKNVISYCNIIVPTYSSPHLTGGIVGEFRNGVIEDCIFAGRITINNPITWACGGIVGISAPPTIIRKCLNIGNIILNNNANQMMTFGGIVAVLSGTIEKCIWAGYIKTDAAPTGELNSQTGFGLGGIVGYSSIIVSPTVSNCIVTGVIEVKGNGNVGAIFGFPKPASLTIINCHYDKQFCIYKGVNGEDIIGQAEGHLTRNMVGRKLASLLGDNDWTYVEGATTYQSLYPQLKTLAHADASKVGASPIFLYDGIKD